MSTNYQVSTKKIFFFSIQVFIELNKPIYL